MVQWLQRERGPNAGQQVMGTLQNAAQMFMQFKQQQGLEEYRNKSMELQQKQADLQQTNGTIELFSKIPNMAPEVAKVAVPYATRQLGLSEETAGALNNVLVKQGEGAKQAIDSINVIMADPNKRQAFGAIAPQLSPLQLMSVLEKETAAQTAAAQQNFENSLEVFKADTGRQQAQGTLALTGTRLGIDQERLAETMRHNQAVENKPPTPPAPPAGYDRNPDGSLKYIPGGPADPAVKEGPAEASALTSAKDALAKVDELENMIFPEGKYVPGKLSLGLGGAVDKLAGPGEAVALFNQASGALRHSRFGASLTEGERQDWIDSFKPSFSDSDATAKRKIKGLRDALAADIAGREGARRPNNASAQQSSPAQPKQGGGLQIGQVVSGYRYLGGDPKNPQSWGR